VIDDMRKRRFTKFGVIAVGIAIISMLTFSLPLIGATSAPDETTAKVEDTSINEDLDDVQEEVEDIDEAGDLNDKEEANDKEETDENLPAGGHEDSNGDKVEHQFEGIE
jgi:hypothetical protein